MDVIESTVLIVSIKLTVVAICSIVDVVVVAV